MGLAEGGDAGGLWMPAGDEEGSLPLLVLGLLMVFSGVVVISVGVLGGSSASTVDSGAGAGAGGRVPIVDACDMLTPASASPSTIDEVITTGVISKATVGDLESVLPLWREGDRLRALKAGAEGVGDDGVCGSRSGADSSKLSSINDESSKHALTN